MTENEAIRELRLLKPVDQDYAIGGISNASGLAVEMAIKALEEVQAYRAIGTIEEFKALKEADMRGANTAVDEFAEKIALEISESIIWDMLATANKNSSLSDTSDKIVDYVIDTAKKIAEQMKGGAG